MAQWGTSCESGILRKNKPKDNHEDLLVFGYACKLFRDDEKALYIDNGKHLIPWMGDDKLLIDRYDCRGALSDIKAFEASREGFDAMRWLGLNESERKIEQLCDKERYYSLHINEEEEQMYKEEEQKRQKANEFQYTYDVPTNPAQEIGPVAPEIEEEDVEYVPSPQLDIPIDIEIPKTVKENARIEKTALFVCKQGPQMEILIKAKQADNPQFGFLNQGHHLYKYYRHVLAAIKSGLYTVSTSAKTDEKNDNQKETEQESKSLENPTNEDHYLHPSLISTPTTTQPDVQTSSIPSIPYKPSANCSYFQLVNRIQQGNQTNENQHQPVNVQSTEQQQQQQLRSNEAFAQMTYEQQQQYYQYYYAAQYYEYYKQLAQYQQGNGQPGQTVQPPETHLDPNIQNYIQQMAYAQYLQQQASKTNPYAQIVSKVNKDVSNPYVALLANLQQEFEQTNPNIPIPPSTTNTPITTTINNVPPSTNTEQNLHYSSSVTVTNSEEIRTVTYNPKSEDNVEIKKPLLSLAQYGSDSEDEHPQLEQPKQQQQQSTKTESDEQQQKKIKEPTGENQIVIDKMASYVAKNGQQFEQIVKAKGDPRFEFLNSNHEFNEYYKKKLLEYRGETEIPEKKEVKIISSTPPRSKEKKLIAPVSFSIKKPKDDGPKEIKSALPVEESDDEGENIDGHTEPQISQEKLQDSITITSTNIINNNSNVTVTALSPVTTQEMTPTNDSNSKNGGSIFDSDDPILEMIDLTDDIEERKDAKRAEDRIKDKLAAAAREKMVSVARDRALQLERKKKAAAFLKLKAETEIKPPEVQKSETVVANSTKRSSSKEIVHIEDSGDDDGEDYKRRSKKKKAHKRKHSKSKHDSKSRKKSKKKRRRSDSNSSTNSKSS